MKRILLNIFWLGIKELQTLWRDKIIVLLIAYAFSFAIYIGATAASMEVHKAPIAFIDQDRSAISMRIMNAFYPPSFKQEGLITIDEGDKGMDAGLYTFVVTIPSGFEKELLQGKKPALQLNIDATRMTQAGIGAGYIQQIINQEVSTFKNDGEITMPIVMTTRMKYNPTLDSIRFGAIMEIINNVAMFSIMLAGASLIREREHGTLEHLMVLPLGASEIMLAKVWSMGLVILVAVSLSLEIVVKGVLDIQLAGSVPLFLAGAFLVLFATTSMGIFMATIAHTMPQFGLIFMMTILPLMMLSGTITPYESMPEVLQYIMSLMPTSHFVSMSQAILYRGADFHIVWQEMLFVFIIGVIFFALTLMIFRKSLESE